MTTTYDEEQARELATRPEDEPGAQECLSCYLVRMLQARGCDGQLLWAGVWRDHTHPQWHALEERLRDQGGYCDCEVLCNVSPPRHEPPEGTPWPPCRASDAVPAPGRPASEGAGTLACPLYH